MLALGRFSSFLGATGRQACSLPGDSTTSQAVSTVSREGSIVGASEASQEGRFPSWGQNYFPDRKGSLQESSLVVSQGGSQVGSHLPRDSTTSQAGITVPSNNTATREGPSNAGNYPSTQAGRQVGVQLGTGPPGFPREQYYCPGQ